MKQRFVPILVAFAMVVSTSLAAAADFQRLKYNNPGLVVDLGVGLWSWPLPMDYDDDGDLDLVVSCSDVPFNGVYFFENPGGNAKMPVFKPAVKLGGGLRNVSVSYDDGGARVLVPAEELTGFSKGDLRSRRKVYHDAQLGQGDKRIRANQWKLVDYDADGALDLVVGQGHWSDYGWDNAFNAEGHWTRGPLHGYVYLLRNKGTTDKPTYEVHAPIMAGGRPVDVFGMPSPNFADFDGDGDLDLLCGDFLDGFTYFQNVGSRRQPKYAAGRELGGKDGPIDMHLCMIVVVAIDWDKDGDIDLVVGQEDGRVALVEHTGAVREGMPVFSPPRFFKQQAADVKFGALVTPVSFDWDADGDEDLVCGNTAGEIGLIENLDGGNPPKWAAPRLLEADGGAIRIMAGSNGSIQGPAEAKWGYTTLSVADWDHDKLPDIVVNSIWGKVVWYRNVGTRANPKLAAAKPIHVQWKDKPARPAWNWWNPQDGELATQWRTTPVVIDWDSDGLNDLVMLDHEGYLALFRRKRQQDGRLVLLPGQRDFCVDKIAGSKFAKPVSLRLNNGAAGKSGRRKLCVVDFDSDGRRDILLNSVNVHFLRNTTLKGGPAVFQDKGNLSSQRLAGHTTSPTTVDWDGNGRRELLVGAEDGFLYYLSEAAKISVAGLTVEGRNFQLATLTNKQRAFSNRDYTWFDVPERLRNWRYTRTAGGELSTITVAAKNDTIIYIATALTQKPVDLTGWEKIDGEMFGYTDANRTRLQVYWRRLKGGEELSIPQGNWTGGLLLLPPNTGGAAVQAPDREPNSLTAAAQNKTARHDRPHVLFIAVDDLRAELGCYGATHIKSPNIDRLARQGTLFNRAYCQQAVCNPSRASLLTGLRLDTLGIWDLPTHFRQKRPDVVTLPQLFKQHGYHTQNIGKVFHNWRQDKYKGDAVSWSVPAVLHYGRHGDDKAKVTGKVPPDNCSVPRCEMRDVPDDAYFDGRVAEKAVAALGKLKDEPFFLAVGFWKPHADFNAPKKYWDMYDRAAIEPPANPEPPKEVPPIAMHDAREIRRAFKQRPGGKPTASDTLALRHGYYAATSYVDAQIGKVINELDRLRLRDRTIIVLWSDHGFHLGEHELWAKTSNFELDARVPLIIATPRHKAGQRTDALVELLDLFPTLADLCGLPAPKDLEGKSLRQVLESPAATVRSAALTQHPRPAYPPDGQNPDAMGYSVRTNRYRYTEWRDFKTRKVLARELYDHENDPRETVNLARQAQHATTIRQLEQELTKLID